jgi:alpha-tubulin suppressor-like RCC1 family protein
MKKCTLPLAELLALAICLAGLSGCLPPLSPLDSANDDGSVVLSFSDARARTIIPDVSLVIAAYDISFTRSGYTTVVLADVPGTATQTQPVSLKPGPWTVTANAKNDTGGIIGVATTAVTVNAGHTTTASLTILSLSGNGQLTLFADTSGLVMSAPSLTGSLTPASPPHDPITVNFDMSSGTPSYSHSVPAGSYLLKLDLCDGAEKLASYVDAVLVAANFPTTGNLSFAPKSGFVVVQFVDQIKRAVPITLNGAVPMLGLGDTMTVTASPAVPVDSYQWYLDGQALTGATSGQVTVESGLAGGDHTLAIVVQKSSVYSCESADFTVASASVAGFSAIGAGNGFTLFVKNDGTLWACGANWYGQLGIGDTITHWMPVQVSTMTGVASVSIGGFNAVFNSMILKTDGTLWACGYNGYGQLGDGTTTDRSTPVLIMADVASVSAGGYHTMILKTDGTLWACGSNGSGELGDGTTINRSAPVQIMADVASVSAGGFHTMILKTDGTLWACGYNGSGVFGAGSPIISSTPVNTMSGVAAVFTGATYTFILKADGTLWACGQNTYGRLGDGTPIDRSTPVQVAAGVATVSSSDSHTMILKTDGTLWACGYNSHGELGTRYPFELHTPVFVTAGVGSVSAGGNHTMILKADGTLWACGYDGYGELGDGGKAIEQHALERIFF